MKSYAELVAALRSKSLSLLSYKLDAEFAADVHAAADVIEQLVKERDFYANYGKPVYADWPVSKEGKK